VVRGNRIAELSSGKSADDSGGMDVSDRLGAVVCAVMDLHNGLRDILRAAAPVSDPALKAALFDEVVHRLATELNHFDDVWRQALDELGNGGPVTVTSRASAYMAE
jgi:hypothetical protein